MEKRKRKHASAAKKQRKRRRRNRHLPEDLLPEILRFLPAKSLLRFRCVSKPWLALVDNDAHFARLHLDTVKNNRFPDLLPEILLFVAGTRRRDCADTIHLISRLRSSLEAVPNGPKLSTIVSSVDGLVLRRCQLVLRRCQSIKSLDAILKLWNSSLRRYLVVPPIPRMNLYSRSETIGLGYDPLAKDYKIVSFISHYSDKISSLAIYTVGTGSWKNIPIRPSKLKSSGRHWIPESHGSAYLQGSLYFFAEDKYKENVRNLLSFDLSNEVFSHISMPNEINKPYTKNLKLFTVGDGSSVAMFDCNNTNSLWVLDTETMNWLRRDLCNLSDTQLFYGKTNCDVLTLGYYAFGHVSSFTESLILNKLFAVEKI